MTAPSTRLHSEFILWVEKISKVPLHEVPLEDLQKFEMAYFMGVAVTLDTLLESRNILTAAQRCRDEVHAHAQRVTTWPNYVK